jgi:hypothetical protein
MLAGGNTVAADDEMDGLPRDPHANLELGTDLDPLDEPPERGDQKRIELVSTVETDLIAKQAA